MSEKTNIQDIAGFCPENAIWKMLADVSDFLLKEETGYQLSADSIIVDGEQFLVTGTKNSVKKEDMVWTLGALAYYAATGHEVFGGHGRRYQIEHPLVALPVLQKSFQELTPVIHACLCYDVSERIEMGNLRKWAQEGLVACSQRKRAISKSVESRMSVKDIVEKWPEEMIEL